MFKKIKLDSKKLATIGLTALILLGSSLALLALKNSRKVQTVESSSVATPRKEEPKKEDTYTHIFKVKAPLVQGSEGVCLLGNTAELGACTGASSRTSE